MICNLITSKDKAGFVTYSTYQSCVGHIVKNCGLRFETYTKKAGLFLTLLLKIIFNFFSGNSQI